jgi:hypothetical protein
MDITQDHAPITKKVMLYSCQSLQNYPQSRKNTLSMEHPLHIILSMRYAPEHVDSEKRKMNIAHGIFKLF